MKKILSILFLVGLVGTTLSAQFKFGAGAALIFDGSSFGVGARGHYTINEDFAGQASFHYYFEDADVTVWTLDLDVHYSGFDIGDVESFSLTPFAGLNFYNVSVIGIGVNETGINIGMNGTMPLSDNLDLYIEPKFIIGGASTLALAAGVYF